MLSFNSLRMTSGFYPHRSYIPITSVNAVPLYDDPAAIQPYFTSGTRSSGNPLTANFGVPLNSPTSYAYTFYRNGTTIVASGSTSSLTVSYSLVLGDVDSLISCVFTASNSVGDSIVMTIPGVLIS